MKRTLLLALILLKPCQTLMEDCRDTCGERGVRHFSMDGCDSGQRCECNDPKPAASP